MTARSKQASVRDRIMSLVVAGLAWLASLTATAAEMPALPADDWPRSSAEAQDLDSEQLARLVHEIEDDERFPDLHSLLIVRHGYLVLEEYFDGWSAGRLHTVQSVTKSLTSALVGIAIEQGVIRGVEEKVLDFFSDTDGIANLDDRKRRLTVEDLLTMRSGTDYHERGSDSPHSRLNRLARGWDRFYLDRPMVSEPGTRFQYDSGGVILLSSLLERRTGLHADRFAERHLFAPLEITRSDWFRNRDGHPHAGGGLSLRPRDMAKLGLLYLRKGRWGDRQVVPSSWVERSTRPHVDLDREPHNIGYGYLWWIHEPDPGGSGGEEIYAAQGFRGQYIFVVPEHDLVVVVTGGTRSYADELRPVGFLYSHILPALRTESR